MRRRFLYLTLFLIIPSMVYCRVSSKIGGQIKSTENNSPIPYVRIEIIRTEETILTDEKGSFTLDRDPNNEPIETVISSIGYREKHYVFEPGIRYAVIALEPEPIIIPGMTIKSKKDNVLTISKSNISVILPKNANDLETAELIAQHPDIVLEENAMGEKSIRILGYEARHVALLIDGVKVNNPAMNSLQAIPLEQIDHIEVLSGNASSTAGNTAMGGAINFVTKNPHNDFTQDVTITAGSWDNYAANLQTSLPIGNVSNLFNLYVHKAINDFFYYNTGEEKDIRRINNDITEGSLSAKNSFNISGHISSALSLQWYKAERGIPGQSTDYMWYDNARAHASKIELKESITAQAGENKLESIFSYQHANSHYVNDIDNYFFSYDSENKSSIFDAILQFDHYIGSCISRAKTGYRYETYSYHDDISPAQSISLKTRNTVFASYETSIPVHIFKGSMSLIPSLRLDKLIDDNAFLSLGMTIEIPRDPDGFQWSISGGNSYTLPEFTSLFWKGDSRVQGNPDLKPERSLGGKTSISWKAGSISMKISGSYDRIEDLIYWYRSAMGIWKPDNLADAELYGFSGTFCWSPFKILSLSLSGSKVFPINKTSGSDHYGNDLPNKPLHKLRSEIALSLLPIELSFSATNLGKQYDNFSNTVEIDGYTTYDIGVSFHSKLSKKLTLHTYFGINNLFDESYETSRNIPAPGRSFECSCKLMFK